MKLSFTAPHRLCRRTPTPLNCLIAVLMLLFASCHPNSKVHEAVASDLRMRGYIDFTPPPYIFGILDESKSERFFSISFRRRYDVSDETRIAFIARASDPQTLEGRLLQMYLWDQLVSSATGHKIAPDIEISRIDKLGPDQPFFTLFYRGASFDANNLDLLNTDEGESFERDEHSKKSVANWMPLTLNNWRVWYTALDVRYHLNEMFNNQMALRE